MSEKGSEVYEEIVMEFLDDCEQMLNEVINLFILLEAESHNQEAINKIFRMVHTVKGNASLLGLTKIKKLAHVMEDLMNLIRQNVVEINQKITNVLLQGIDRLKRIIQNIRNQKPEVDDEEDYQSFLMQITLFFDSLRKEDSEVLWNRMQEYIFTFESKFSSDDICLKTMWKKIFQTFNSLLKVSNKENGDQINVTQEKKEDIKKNILSLLKQEFEDTLSDEHSEKIFSFLKSLEVLVTPETLVFIQESVKEYEEVVPIDGFTSFLAEIILEKVEHVQLKSEGVVREIKKEKVLEDAPVQINKTMRIHESAIDAFLELIGELVVIGETYGHIEKRFSEEFGLVKAVSDLKKNNASFNDLSLDLQNGVLDIRRVPIKTLLERAPRIIRDVAAAQDKKIHIDIRGEEILIDKSLLETIEGPFIHMVRNAADHGMESKIERQKNGKSEGGTILIEVSEDDEMMRIVVKDDGKGIDRESILDAAVKKGMILSENRSALVDQEVFNLLFEPGFSTAKEVTDISGRGVGMDVVKKNIESLGGQIFIESVFGEGSTFTIETPKKVCVRIIEGFLVMSSENRFVIPMACVGESFKIFSGDITLTLGEGECIMHHESVFSVRRLDHLLNLNGHERKEEGIGVIIDAGQHKTVLFVDDVLGTQQVVIKDIEGLSDQSELITGGAILGDERVAIVLNLENL